MESPERPFVVLCGGANRALHSFPTRRSSDLQPRRHCPRRRQPARQADRARPPRSCRVRERKARGGAHRTRRSRDRKSTRLNSSHMSISYAVFCLKKKINDAKIADKIEVLTKL